MPFPIEEEYIMAAELELQLRFPQSFRNKMIEENGGELFIVDHNWQIFPFFDQSNPKRKMRTCNHIVRETKLAQAWDGFPESAIAFAQNGCGNYLIFLPDPLKPNVLAESIFVWFHETHQVEQLIHPVF